MNEIATINVMQILLEIAYLLEAKLVFPVIKTIDIAKTMHQKLKKNNDLKNGERLLLNIIKSIIQIE